jgi:CRP-like cAMP-binding protein
MAINEETLSFLAKVPLFQRLNNSQLRKIADRIMPRTYQPGQEIVTQGKSGFGMFLITSGHAEVVLDLSDGSQSVVNTFGPTDFFGEVSMLDGGPRTASVIAREKTKCLVLGRVEFISLLHNDAEMATEIAVALAQRLRRALASI